MKDLRSLSRLLLLLLLFTDGCLVVGALFVENTVFGPLYCLCSAYLFKISLLYLYGSLSGLFTLFH